MKKIIISVALLVVGMAMQAQSEINENYPLSNEEKVSIKFEYPSLVKVYTWDKKEVQVNAQIDIDGGEQNEDFSIKGSSNNGTFYLRSKLSGLSKKQNYYFNSDDDDDNVRIKDNGHTIYVGDKKSNYREGVRVEIVVTIYVPEDMEVDVDAKFGIVEVLGVPQSLEVDSEFGGIDVAIDTKDIDELDAETSWGQIFSNLDGKIDLSGGEQMGKAMRASLNSSGKKKLYLDTKFGNVYLRKN